MQKMEQNILRGWLITPYYETPTVFLSAGQLKQTSSRLESQQRQMEDLQQRFLLFSSQINFTLQVGC